MSRDPSVKDLGSFRPASPPDVDLRPIPGFDQGYAAAADGRIWSRKSGWKAAHVTPKGYVRASLRHNGKNCSRGVHRLVAMAWIPNPLGLPQVNHINGDKTDNHVENLEWVTCHENMRHAWAAGLYANRGGHRGEVNGLAKLTWYIVREIRASNENGEELARRLGVARSTVNRVRSGRTWIEPGCTGDVEPSPQAACKLEGGA